MLKPTIQQKTLTLSLTNALTVNSNLAVAIRVAGLQKLLGLFVGQSSGTGREVLQEQPGEEPPGVSLI